MGQAFLVAAYLAAVASPLLARWLAGGAEAISARTPAGMAEACLLLAFPVLALQPVLAARLRLLDRRFGIVNVYLFHKLMGMTAALLLLMEPPLLAAGPAGWQSLAHPPAAHLRNLGLAALLAQVTVSLLFGALKMKYERWRTVHNVLALVTVVSVFAYGWAAAPALRTPTGRAVWVLLLLAALAAYGHHRVIGPLRRRRRPWRVAEVRRETGNIWTLALDPPEGTPPLRYLPGQFQFLTFYRGRGLPVEEHHFTISTGGYEPRHASTIKVSGDFTATIGMTQPGDAVAVQAPFGSFSYLLHPRERDLVFVAGGIGITPLMAMLRNLRDGGSRHEVLLIYANRGEQDIVFRAELDAMSAAQTPRLRVIHVLSQPGESWPGERGIVDRDFIARSAPSDLRERGWYVCGPPAMIGGVLAALAALGVPSGRVHSERFSI